jgi:hypothetical protein
LVVEVGVVQDIDPVLLPDEVMVDLGEAVMVDIGHTYLPYGLTILPPPVQ